MTYTELPDYLRLAIDKVCSPEYSQTFEIVAKEQSTNISREQSIILTSYPNTITWYEGDRRPEIIERIRQAHLKWFNTWLNENYSGQPPYLRWGSIMQELVLHVSNLLFRIDLGDAITSEDSRNTCRQIADTVKRILLAVKTSNPTTIDEAAMPLVRLLLVILFYFTLDNDLNIYLKSLQLVDLMNELIKTSNNDDEIHLQAYRLLAVMMVEENIKQLQNSSRIATVFITFIENTIDGGISHAGRLHNTLRSLKVLTQHDQIRQELIKQGGHLLFLRCALEDGFDPLKAKLPALEILLALIFDKDFAATLKDNEIFMGAIRQLSSSSQEYLQRVATALVWKLEKETGATTKNIEGQSSSSGEPTIAKKQYDIMISYSHSDKDLCHRILNNLENDQLRVWIDSKLMHGATFDAMAKAIENAEFVFVCMSDAYKQSPFCEMEASYAIKRRCRIIPLVMTPNYKADGWLGVLTSAFIYIDFPKLGFAKGYAELKKQIQLIRSNDSHSTVTKPDQIHHNPILLESDIPKTSSNVANKKEPRPIVDYPHCIDKWTEEHIKSFLLDKDLDILLPVIEGMNGQLLRQVYSMCQANQQGMFLSMKEDVARSQYGMLSLKDYLTFLKEIKPYIPYSIDHRQNSTSAVCNVM